MIADVLNFSVKTIARLYHLWFFNFICMIICNLLKYTNLYFESNLYFPCNMLDIAKKERFDIDMKHIYILNICVYKSTGMYMIYTSTEPLFFCLVSRMSRQFYKKIASPVCLDMHLRNQNLIQIYRNCISDEINVYFTWPKHMI